MFVANPSLTPSRAAPMVAVSPVTPWLIAWAAIGALALLLVEASRGDALLGATLPFWLVGAPLIDLVWVERARISRWLAMHARARLRRRQRPAARYPLRGPRRLASIRRRNSIMMRR